MDSGKIDKFRDERIKLNELVMKYAGKNIKRLFAIDQQVYSEGALPAKTKELLGLVASLVLRCDDCILYHVMRCEEEGVTSEELEETLAIGMAVGGSITIPHLRRAIKAWDERRQNKKDKS